MRTQYHEWEWFKGVVPEGAVQIQCASQSRVKAEAAPPQHAHLYNWGSNSVANEIIAFRRVKLVVYGTEVIVWYEPDHCQGTHDITVPTEDGIPIVDEYVGKQTGTTVTITKARVLT